jgi:hypothetical protein
VKATEYLKENEAYEEYFNHSRNKSRIAGQTGPVSTHNISFRKTRTTGNSAALCITLLIGGSVEKDRPL